MALYNESLRNYILDVVNKFDLHARCAELSAIFARSNIRDLQDVFPTVVHSIFGFSAGSGGVPGVGWGLRTSVQNSMNPAFDLLNDFLHPTGPMLLLCYRLLHDSIKFEFDFNLLPHKVAESIRSGHCAQFYSDLVNVDPIRRHITSLSLNAFDYYMLHFIIHGTLPLHKIHPFALCVHNECSKTAYFFLCAEYLCNFLPSAPDSVVLPTNVCATVKAPQPTMPTLQPLQPQRSPKYLKIPNLNMYGNNNAIASSPTTNSATTIESPRTYAWRSETVLNFFIDIWLRFDVEEVRDLPGSEFIRVVRLLVKQAHSFANSAPLDHTAMSQLRKQARPMMRLRIYSFLKGIIDRWPLDGSLIVVLELWLSYIQPWRYRFELQRHGCNLSESISLQGFEDFIADNLLIYTQIFSFVMARFERLDFALLSNASMLFRVVKVFSQKYLAPQLAQAEATYLGNYARNIDSPQRRLGQYGRTNQTFNSSDSAWDSNRFYQDDAYIPLFGTSMQVELERFLRSLQISKRYVQQEIQMIRDHTDQERTRLGYVKRFVNLFVNEVSPMNEKLQKMIDIPELIKASMRGLSLIFNIDLQTIVMDNNYETNVEQNNLRASNISSFSDTSSGYLNMSTLSPIKMRHNVSNIRASIDPALYPIQSHECEFLVRFLHHLSTKLNEMFGQEMQRFYHRDDIWGRLARQILYEPMTAQWFDKPRGIKELCEEQLPARLILRPLGSYKFIATLCFSILLGYLLWGSITCGVFILLLAFLFYILIKALI